MCSGIYMNGGGIKMERINERRQGAWNIVRGLALSAAVSIVFLLILAFVMLKMQPDMEKMQMGIFLTYVLSCFAGGMYCGKKSERQKFIWGCFVGILYFLILFVISHLWSDAGAIDFTQGAIAFVLCALGGMAGGMLAGG